jgi:hypothetical protein
MDLGEINIHSCYILYYTFYILYLLSKETLVAEYQNMDWWQLNGREWTAEWADYDWWTGCRLEDPRLLKPENFRPRSEID